MAKGNTAAFSHAAEQTLNQFEALPLPESHPAVPQFDQLFGEHTYFLDGCVYRKPHPDWLS